MTTDRRVAIVGLGYVGLPLAIAFAEAGLDVEGVDASPRRVAEIRERRSPIDDITDARLAGALDGTLRVAVPDEASLEAADAVFVCVPTPITTTKDPDLGPVLSAAALIRDHLRAGQLVVLQSTTFPGTTTGPFRAVLERDGPARRTRLRPRVRAGARQPRRSGQRDPRRAPPRRRIHAGRDRSGRRAAAPRQRPGRRAELARCRGDGEAAREHVPQRQHRVHQPARAAVRADGPRRLGGHRRRRDEAVRVHAFTPGPGVGGHCIPVDPYYLAWRAREFDFTDRFIELAGDINFGMPRHVVELVAEALNERWLALRGAKVGVIGVAFKPDVQDDRELARCARARRSRRARRRGALPRSAGAPLPRRGGRRSRVRGLDTLLGWADVIVVVTPTRRSTGTTCTRRPTSWSTP